jgi:hypothetical protein
MKGGSGMGCNHERLKAIGDRLFCKDCGTELPPEILINGEKQAEKPAAEEKTGKPSTKKRTAKKAV